MIFYAQMSLFIHRLLRLNQDARGAVYLLRFAASLFVSLPLGGNLFFNCRRCLVVVAVQNLTAAFRDLLDGRIGFLDAVLHLEGAFGRPGDEHTCKKAQNSNNKATRLKKHRCNIKNLKRINSTAKA